MRGSLSAFVAAAAIAGVAAISFPRAEAAQWPSFPAPAAQGGGSIIQVGEWLYHGDTHNAWKEDGWNDGRRYRDRRQFRRHAYRPRTFYFGFPFAFAPPYYPYNRQRDCFRTWDGQLVCRR